MYKLPSITVLITIILLSSPALSATLLVWDHDMGQTLTSPDDGVTQVGTEIAIHDALHAYGFAGNEIAKLGYLPSNLTPYDAIFVLAGFWSKDGTLSYQQRLRLGEYLDGGGKLYIEGTELGNRYGTTPFYGKLGIDFVDDGRPVSEGNVDQARGIGSLIGINLNYTPYQKEDPDSFVDEIREEDTAEIVMVSKRTGNQSNGRVALYTSDTIEAYRVVYSSLIFGGLQNGDEGTRNQLMARYIVYFGIAPSGHTGIESATLGEIKATFK